MQNDNSKSIFSTINFEVKKENFEKIKVADSIKNNRFSSVNAKFIAFVTQSDDGGTFLVLPLQQVGKVPIDTPQIVGHSGQVNEIEWCLHDDNLIASASDDKTVKVWQIPDAGLKSDLKEPKYDLKGHKERVDVLQWHPTCSSILLSGGNDKQVIIWSLSKQAPLVKVAMEANAQCASWNYGGSKYVVSCDNQHGYVYHGADYFFKSKSQLHEYKGFVYTAFLKNDNIISTGYNKFYEANICLWDANLAMLYLLKIDSGMGTTIFPIYDPDINLLYIFNKGDVEFSIYELFDSPPYFKLLKTFKSKNQLKYICSLPKRSVDVRINELARIYKTNKSGHCEIISLIVPNKTEQFSKELFPDTFSGKPSISEKDWMDNKYADPILISLDPEIKLPEITKDSLAQELNHSENIKNISLHAELNPPENIIIADYTNASSRDSSTSAATTEVQSLPQEPKSLSLPFTQLQRGSYGQHKPESTKHPSRNSETLANLKTTFTDQQKRIKVLEQKLKALEEVLFYEII